MEPTARISRTGAGPVGRVGTPLPGPVVGATGAAAEAGASATIVGVSTGSGSGSGSEMTGSTSGGAMTSGSSTWATSAEAAAAAAAADFAPLDLDSITGILPDRAVVVGRSGRSIFPGAVGAGGRAGVGIGAGAATGAGATGGSGSRGGSSTTCSGCSRTSSSSSARRPVLGAAAPIVRIGFSLARSGTTSRAIVGASALAGAPGFLDFRWATTRSRSSSEMLASGELLTFNPTSAHAWIRSLLSILRSFASVKIRIFNRYSSSVVTDNHEVPAMCA